MVFIINDVIWRGIFAIQPKSIIICIEDNKKISEIGALKWFVLTHLVV